MSAWILVPCLVALREEFNQLSPRRDKGADGSIGDSAHTSSSDHTPDEDSWVLRDHDGDSKNEVHALDIDSTGPWPEPFDVIIKRLVDRERTEYNSATMVGRLQNVIWNRRIASRSWGWAWHPHTGGDPHTNHAHFSARYTAEQESDTRPWGVFAPTKLEDDMAELTPANLAAIGKAAADAVWERRLSSTSTAKRWPDNPSQPASNWLLLSAIHGKDGAVADVADVQRDNILLAAVQAGQVNAQEFAEAVVAQLPQEQVQAFFDALAARLRA